MRVRLLSLAAAAATATLVAASLPAAAQPTGASRPAPIATHVVSRDAHEPLNIAFGRHSVLVADAGRSAVTKLTRDGRLAPLIRDVPGASGVAVNRRSKALAYTTTSSTDGVNTAGGLHIRSSRGRVFADIFAVERANNPDQNTTYGIVEPSQCQRDTFAAIGQPVSYTGVVDSQASSVTAWRHHWIVADAGANTLWVVNRSGGVRLLAVLPVQPYVITEAVAVAFGLDDCAIGARYGFEAQPTDVEWGEDGYLYVTTLPRVPASPALPALGAVWKVNPWSGHAWRIAAGFTGPTNLALGHNGRIYVAEPDLDRISVVKDRRPAPYATVRGVVAVETSPQGALWAATAASEDPAGPGTLVRVTRQHRSRS